MRRLASALFQAGVVDRPQGSEDQLEAALEAVLIRAHNAWPGVHVDSDTFVRYVGARLPRDRDPVEALGAVSTDGLYAACACAAGDAGAIAAVEDALFGVCDVLLARYSNDTAFGQEVKQRVREKLFVAGPNQRPRIAEYSGRGDLRTFVRVALAHEAISLRRKTWREIASDDDGPTGQLETADPELLYLKRVYAAEFARAFEAALASLTSEERNVLRYHYVDRLNIDHIGAIYRVHRVSAARRLNRARLALVDSTRRGLASRLELGSTDLRSVLRLIQSDVDVSLRRALGPPTKE